jgi:APA family basic amino acid/polyamine antiporter
MPRDVFARKPISAFHRDLEAGTGHSLRRTLGALDLTLLGVGAIIGTGIFVLTGVAAVDHAGPGVVVSFAVSGFACALAALCYAEFATMMPISGSAYSYAYATLGELLAWIIGWDLILEYALAASAVAVGWSGYLRDILSASPLAIPNAVASAPGTLDGAILNLPALLILLAVTAVLVIGIRESARTNAAIVVIKTFVVLFVIAAGIGYVQPANWQPFAPQGWNGIMAGAAMVFFAYIGFDAVTTAAEETRRPQRDMAIGILASLGICTALYLAVAAVVTGMSPLSEIDRSAPVAVAFRRLGLDFAASLISLGALAGLTSVLLVMLLGQSRIFFAMSRDGLLPAWFSRVHPRYRTPHVSTALVGLVVAVIAAFVPLEDLVGLVNIGTLFAFVIVSGGVIVLRRTEPDLPRPFRCPFVPGLPLLSIAACVYLMTPLPFATWIRFLGWLAIGLAIYAVYGNRHSRVHAPGGSSGS